MLCSQALFKIFILIQNWLDRDSKVSKDTKYVC